MIKSFSITGYRKFNKIKVDDLGKVNVITGINNSGKSSFLEAVFAWSCGNNIGKMLKGSIARSARYMSKAQKSPYWFLDLILQSFYERKEAPLSMCLSAVDENSDLRAFTHTVLPSDLINEVTRLNAEPAKVAEFYNAYQMTLQKLSDSSSLEKARVFPTIAKWTVADSKGTVNSYDITQNNLDNFGLGSFINTILVDVLSHTKTEELDLITNLLKRAQLLNNLVDDLKEVFPFVKTIDLITYPDRTGIPFVFTEDKNDPLPIYAFGDGLQRYFYILGSMILNQNGIMCIDEVDVGLHYSSQIDFCHSLLKYAHKYNVQVFLTTHNLEFLDNLIDATDKSSMLDDLRVITLKKSDTVMKHRVLSGMESKRARFGFELDLR